jgi:thiol-disulfide isomerase/thioredoxin
LYFSTQLCFAQTTTVKGKLLNSNGEPSTYALVGIAPVGYSRATGYVNCNEDGEYSLSLKQPGLFYLQFCMPDYNAVYLPILNNEEKEIELNVSLGTYEYEDGFDNAAVIGEFNNYDFKSAVQMTKEDEDTYTFELEHNSLKFKYQLLKIDKNRSINGTMSESFEPDSTGDFRSVVSTVDGKVKIIFKPSLLAARNTEPKIECITPKFDKDLIAFFQDYQKVFSDGSSKLTAHYKEHKETKTFSYDDSGYSVKLNNMIQNEPEGLMWDIYKTAFIQLADLKPVNFNFGLATEYFASVDPESYSWSLYPSAFFQIYNLIPQYQQEEYFEKFLKEANDRLIKVNILINRLSSAKMSGDEERFTEIYNLLEKEYGDLDMAKQMLKMFPKVSKIKVGVEIPDFEVVSLDDPDVKFSKTSMMGKVYLIDFWATWCGPCVGEMETLHNAYEKYKEKGFEIVSLSLDSKVEDVTKFRNERWKMPWKNAFIGDDNERIIANKFEVAGIPKPILVDNEGKIVAMEIELRGNSLQSTIEKHLK